MQPSLLRFTLAFLVASFTLGALSACAGGRAASRSAPPAGAARSTPSPATAAVSPATAAIEEAAIGVFAERLIGGWIGAGDSPFGEIPFAALFERQADGSVRSWADDGNGSKIDLHLHQKEGRWVLTESASLPGVGTQTHTLVPTALEGDRLVLHHPERPGFLSIELRLVAAPAGATSSASADATGAPGATAAQELHLSAKLRGEDHVAFAMKRIPDQALDHMRRRIHPPGTAPAVR